MTEDNVFVKADATNIIVVPESARQCVLEYLHSNFGHIGINKLVHNVKLRFYWPNLHKDVADFCGACHLCAVNKDNRPPNNVSLHPIDVAMLQPYEKVAMDILGPLPESKDGSKYVLILQDYFSKWPEAIALKSVTSEVAKNWLITDILPRYGIFSKLITDNGVQFVSETFKDVCKSVGIKQKFTSPFHPQTDGMVEKFNRTFLNMMRNYVNVSQNDWSSHIPLIMFAYRTSVHDSTGVTPAEALQGRQLKLHIDVIKPPSLELNSESIKQLDYFLDKFKVIRSQVRSNSEKALVKRQQCYDKAKKRCIRDEYKPNELVYWKKPVAKKGLNPKLSQIWQGPFRVKEKLSDINYILSDDKNSNATVRINNL